MEIDNEKLFIYQELVNPWVMNIRDSLASGLKNVLDDWKRELEDLGVSVDESDKSDKVVDDSGKICFICKKSSTFVKVYQCFCGEYFCYKCYWNLIYDSHGICPNCNYLVAGNVDISNFKRFESQACRLVDDYLKPLEMTTNLIFMGLYFRNESGKLVMPKLLKTLREGGFINKDLLPSPDHFRSDLRYAFESTSTSTSASVRETSASTNPDSGINDEDKKLKEIEYINKKYKALATLFRSTEKFFELVDPISKTLGNLRLAYSGGYFDGKNRLQVDLLQLETILGVSSDRDYEFMISMMKELEKISPTVEDEDALTCAAHLSAEILEIPDFKDIFTKIFTYFMESREIHYEFKPLIRKGFVCENCGSVVEVTHDHDHLCEKCDSVICNECFRIKNENHVCTEEDRRIRKRLDAPKCLYCGDPIDRLWDNFVHCDSCNQFYKTNHINYGGVRNDSYARFFHYNPTLEDLLTIDPDHGYWIREHLTTPRDAFIDLLKINYNDEFIDSIMKLREHVDLYHSQKDKLINIFYKYVRKNDFVIDIDIDPLKGKYPIEKIFPDHVDKEILISGIIVNEFEFTISKYIKNKDLEHLNLLIKNIDVSGKRVLINLLVSLGIAKSVEEFFEKFS